MIPSTLISVGWWLVCLSVALQLFSLDSSCTKYLLYLLKYIRALITWLHLFCQCCQNKVMALVLSVIVINITVLLVVYGLILEGRRLVTHYHEHPSASVAPGGALPCQHCVPPPQIILSSRTHNITTVIIIIFLLN